MILGKNVPNGSRIAQFQLRETQVSYLKRLIEFPSSIVKYDLFQFFFSQIQTQICTPVQRGQIKKTSSHLLI